MSIASTPNEDTMTETRWMKHGHHDVLFEPIIGSIEGRIENIRADKPADEIPTRLRLIEEIDPSLLPSAVREAGAALRQAAAAYDRAGSGEAMTYNQAREASEQAWKVWIGAGKAYDKALETHHDELEALHKRVCVADCPWDGKTIFPEADQ